VTEVLRNTKDAIADLFMLIACGLHNLRVRYRKRRLKLGHEPLFRIKSIDFVNEAEGPGARVAVELTPESARKLAHTILEMLERAENSGYLSPREPA
jgi:hypothetical protein